MIDSHALKEDNAMPYENITKSIQNQIYYDSQSWLKDLSKMNEKLDSAESVQDYRNILNDMASMHVEELQTKAAWNNLSYSLRRYIYESFMEKGRDELPEAYVVVLKNDGSGKKEERKYCFSPVDFRVEPDEKEMREYADLLYNITLQNKCYAIDKSGAVNFFKGAITKQDYIDYLLQKKAISRKRLFAMSLALKFNVSTMINFSNVLGESPAYNFRNVEEIIYYYCHLHSDKSNMETFRYIKFEYESRCRKEDQNRNTVSALNTKQIEKDINDIVRKDFGSLEAQLDYFIQYLVSNKGEFIGYSKTALQYIMQELSHDMVLNFDYKLISPDVVVGMQLKRWIENEDKNGKKTAKEMGLSKLGDEIYNELFMGEDLQDDSELDEENGGLASIKEVNLDKRITENLLQGKRLNELIEGKTAVTKKDVLILRLYKMEYTIDFSALSEFEHREVLREFQSSTDRILQSIGLPPIYAANPFDNLVMVSLCARSPVEYMASVFKQASAK